MKMDLKHWFSLNHKGAFNHSKHGLLDRGLNQLKRVMSFEGREQQQGSTVKTCSNDDLNFRSPAVHLVPRYSDV